VIKEIVYYSESSFPSETANSLQVAKMCSAFFNLGYAVEVYGYLDKDQRDNISFFYNVSSEIKFKDLPVHPKNSKLSRIIAFIINCLYIFVLSFTKTNSIFVSRSRMVLPIFIFRRKTVFEIHSVGETAFRRLIDTFIITRSNKIIAISHALKFDLEKSLRKNRSKIVVLHDGADLLKTLPSIQTQVKNIGYVGLVSYQRGLGIILELARRMPNLNFHLVGRMESSTLDFTHLDFPENLLYHGFVKQSELSDIYNDMDILIAPYIDSVPTIKWASPLKIFEYMSQNRPIIISDFPVFKEILTHYETCIFVDHSSVSDWEEAIKMLASNQRLRLKLSNKAYEELGRFYLWEMRAKKMLDGIN
jgi:glycosyltransferase involved in cell wall biosynthesis